MESVLGRYRNLIILVGVLFLQVLGLATQVKRGGDQQHTRLIRIWVVGAITPFERAVIWMENGAGNLWHNYFYLRGVRAENRELKQQIEQMRIEQVRLSEDAAQARRLQNLLAFKEQFISKTLAAQVIGTSGTDSNRVVYIDKGASDGITRDMAVITADGIVGKVSLVYPSEAQVLLINDQMSGVGVILNGARLQGWLGGTANGEVMLNAVMSDEQVPLGEKVMTSGGDRIFPKGLPVGTVAKVGKGRDLFLNITVKPAANLSKLEEVLVVVEKQERQAMADGDARVRAADVLAQRLPSVPDKPADATPAGTDPKAVTKPASGATPAAAAGTISGTAPGKTATPALKKLSGPATGNPAPAQAANVTGTTPSISVVRSDQPATTKPAARPAGSQLMTDKPKPDQADKPQAAPANSGPPSDDGPPQR